MSDTDRIVAAIEALTKEVRRASDRQALYDKAILACHEIVGNDHIRAIKTWEAKIIDFEGGNT